jgi:hypothetical protein
MDLAYHRNKQVLCFSLNDVVPFYVRHGFRQCPELFPEQPWHIGKFLVAELDLTILNILVKSTV